MDIQTLLTHRAPRGEDERSIAIEGNHRLLSATHRLGVALADGSQRDPFLGHI